jgi:AcrR family transcriptional regulator
MEIMTPKVNEEYKIRKKTELLQAAKRVFIDKGFTRATMQDIMDESGVSRGALYAYFGNLERVYLEVLKQEDQRDIFYFRTEDAGTSWEQITKWILKQQKEIENIDQTLLQANSEFFLSSGYRKNKESFPYIIERYEQIIDVLSGFFRKGAVQGEFSPRLPVESVSRYLVSFMDGLMLDTAHLGTGKTKVKEQLDALLFTLEVMLCPAQKNEQ